MCLNSVQNCIISLVLILTFQYKKSKLWESREKSSGASVTQLQWSLTTWQCYATSFQSLEWDDSLSSDCWAVVFHDCKTKEHKVFEVNPEEELLIPHGVQSVPMDGLRAEVAAVQRHAQDINLDTRASRAVTWAHILTRDDLREETRIHVAEDKKETKAPSAPHCFPTQRTLWNGWGKWLINQLKQKGRVIVIRQPHGWRHGKSLLCHLIDL